MRKIIGIILLTGLLCGCGNKEDENTFSIKGEIKNMPDQKVYLQEIYFGNRNPEVLDTAEVKNGKFELSAISPQEGMFRVVFEKNEILFLAINDKKQMVVSTDVSKLSPQTLFINTPANASLYNFMAETNKRGEVLDLLAAQLKAAESLSDTTTSASDPGKEYSEKEEAFRNYVYAYADTCNSPTLALFALGYVSKPPSERLLKSVTALVKRFPAHKDASTVLKMVTAYREEITQPAAPAKIPQPGDTGPDITMPDTDGQTFSLSSLRGKYVLVDFWASWCGPCRKENPNVVNAYNKYRDKNFTVLGVSLDKSKEAWLEAIEQDGLIWKNISDLKHWQSAAQRLYQFQSIPYNVLIDPDGKIIATELRGQDLDKTLESVLK
jgi:peroxiredoxin